MKKTVKICGLLLSLLLVLTSCNSAVEDIPSPEVKNTVSKEDIKLENDFYGYINYDFIRNGKIATGETGYNAYSKLEQDTANMLEDIVKECVSSNPKKGSDEQKIKDIYLQYLDDKTREEVGMKPFDNIIQSVSNAKNIEEYVKVAGELYLEYGCNAFIRFRVMNDFCNEKENAVYLYPMDCLGYSKDDILKSNSTEETSLEFIKEVFEQLGYSEDEIKERTANVWNMIESVAIKSHSPEEYDYVPNIYNVYSKSEFSKLYSNVEVDNMLKSFGVKSDRIIVYDVEQSEKINELLTEENLQTVKDYTILSIITRYRKYLPKSYSEALETIDEISYDKEKTAIEDITGNLFDYEIGYIYAKKVCTEDALTYARKIVEDLRSACGNLIDKSDRLSDSAKKSLHKKLDNMIFLIGYDKNGYSRDFDIVPAESGGNLLENIININKYKVNHEMSEYGKPVDRNQWAISSQTYNAVYNQELNNITIPAVWLVEGLFSTNEKDYAKNLGSFGFLVGHEMNHAFDNTCIFYDENGNYNQDWLSKEDFDGYKELFNKIEKAYDNYSILDVYYVNGKKTIGENIADLGGTECILSLVKSKEDVQTIFEEMAKTWATLVTTENAIEAIYADVHSPEETRINEVLSLNETFYETYEISEGDGMYIAPEERIKVW